MLQKHKRVVRKVNRTSYSIEKKREVVNYAEQHDRRAAANYFNLNISIVEYWVRASKTWTTKTNSSVNSDVDRKELEIETDRSEVDQETELEIDI
ncbi:15118_t:CDS:2, partial [Funneliformis geosporum]